MTYYNRYSNLTVTHLNQEQHARTCGYWYTVQNKWTAHTAFATRAGLDRWLADRGLSITGDIETELWCKIEGEYQTALEWMPSEEFQQIEGKRIKVMSNAQWTMGIVNTEDGITTVHYLNPNCHDRPVYDYATTNKEQR